MIFTYANCETEGAIGCDPCVEKLGAFPAVYTPNLQFSYLPATPGTYLSFVHGYADALSTIEGDAGNWIVTGVSAKTGNFIVSQAASASYSFDGPSQSWILNVEYAFKPGQNYTVPLGDSVVWSVAGSYNWIAMTQVGSQTIAEIQSAPVTLR